MPLTDSTSFIEKQDAYFGGAFQTGSMRPWSPLLSANEPLFQVTLHHSTHDGRIRNSIEYSGAADPATRAKALIRILCHVLVDRLPEAAIFELLESLRSIFEFYQEPPHLPALPAHPTTFTAKFSGTYVRPTFEISEE